MHKKTTISPSILAANFANLGHEVNAALNAGAGAIHFDVMDHHFVPNLSFGAPICQSLRKAGIDCFIDAHLMVTNPDDFIDEFAQAGANLLTFHPETSLNVDQTISKINAAGMEAGLAYNPDKSVDITPAQLEQCGMILLMSVFPGFGGQAFIPETLDKLKSTRTLIDQHNPNCRLGIDGGIKVGNIGDAAKAGADYFIVGSGLFSADDYNKRMHALTSAIKSSQ